MVSYTPNACTAIYSTVKQDFTTLESSVTAISFSPGLWRLLETQFTEGKSCVKATLHMKKTQKKHFKVGIF